MQNGGLDAPLRRGPGAIERAVRFVEAAGPARSREASAAARTVVAEPLGDVPGAWSEVTEAMHRIAGRGRDGLRPSGPLYPLATQCVIVTSA